MLKMTIMLRFCAMRAMGLVMHPMEGLTAPLSKAGAEVLPKLCDEFHVGVFAVYARFNSRLVNACFP